MSKETRDRIAFRMQPETRRRIEQWYAADNCQSKNEFIYAKRLFSVVIFNEKLIKN